MLNLYQHDRKYCPLGYILPFIYFICFSFELTYSSLTFPIFLCPPFLRGEKNSAGSQEVSTTLSETL